MTKVILPQQGAGPYTAPRSIMIVCGAAFGSGFTDEARDEVTTLVRFIQQKEYEPAILATLSATRFRQIFAEALEATNGWLLESFVRNNSECVVIRHRIKLAKLFMYVASSIEAAIPEQFQERAKARLFTGVEYVFDGTHTTLMQLIALDRGQIRLVGQVGRVGKHHIDALHLTDEQVARMRTLEHLENLAKE